MKEKGRRIEPAARERGQLGKAEPYPESTSGIAQVKHGPGTTEVGDGERFRSGFDQNAELAAKLLREADKIRQGLQGLEDRGGRCQELAAIDGQTTDFDDAGSRVSGGHDPF